MTGCVSCGGEETREHRRYTGGGAWLCSRCDNVLLKDMTPPRGTFKTAPDPTALEELIFEVGELRDGLRRVEAVLLNIGKSLQEMAVQGRFK